MNKYAIENLFGIQGFHIAWYGVIIGMGMLLGVLLASYHAKKSGYKTDLIFDLAIIALPSSIICARIYYVIFEWEEYVQDPIRIFAIRQGGLAIYGGIIGGLLATALFCRRHKFPVLLLFDFLMPSLALGQAIGRWGNFMNQEAYGNIIMDPKLQFFPYGVYIDAIGEWHQATFFYESMWDLLVFIILMLLARKGRKPGTLFAVYLIGYGMGRTVIEGLRTDSLYLTGNIRVSQLLSLILVAAGAGLLVLLKQGRIKSREHTGKYLL